MSCLLNTFEAKSKNIACSFLGLPVKALTAALELMAIVRRRLSSGMMNPSILSSADGILSKTYKDKDHS